MYAADSLHGGNLTFAVMFRGRIFTKEVHKEVSISVMFTLAVYRWFQHLKSFSRPISVRCLSLKCFMSFLKV